MNLFYNESLHDAIKSNGKDVLPLVIDMHPEEAAQYATEEMKGFITDGGFLSMMFNPQLGMRKSFNTWTCQTICNLSFVAMYCEIIQYKSEAKRCLDEYKRYRLTIN